MLQDLQTHTFVDEVSTTSAGPDFFVLGGISQKSDSATVSSSDSLVPIAAKVVHIRCSYQMNSILHDSSL